MDRIVTRERDPLGSGFRFCCWGKNQASRGCARVDKAVRACQPTHISQPVCSLLVKEMIRGEAQDFQSIKSAVEAFYTPSVTQGRRFICCPFDSSSGSKALPKPLVLLIQQCPQELASFCEGSDRQKEPSRPQIYPELECGVRKSYL